MRFHRDKNFIYPWRDGNAFELIADGEYYFPQIFQHIDNSSRFIIIEQYLVESGRITTLLIDHLVKASQRGVTVFLLFDEYGAQKLRPHDRQRLYDANIQLRFYNPVKLQHWYGNLRRNHRKFICIDGTSGFTGGAGFTDEFDTVDNPLGWHDVQLKISGPVLADWLTSFNLIWSQYASSVIDTAVEQALTDSNMQGRLTIAHTPRHQEISHSLIKQIRRSYQTVWLATPYFVAPRKLRRELKRAAQRGVDVRLLLANTHSDHPWITHAYRSYYRKLLQHGVRIFEYQPRFLHAKVILCDQWTSIGSSNLDRWNRRWSMDANQEINNKPFSDEIRTFFENDFKQSREILLAEWNKRGWLQRFKEKCCQKIVLLLEMLGRSHRN
ncbi:MAG: phospholipase D-like domain-containing protein [Thioalkalispiraceae bacterium]|jgi:phosphatidylserine/phosphatidylglycerophosphate/cardiolipin synthase-like enzyme